MKTFAAVVSELVGLFIDDGSLAIGTVLVFVLATVAALTFHAPALLTGTILLAGCVGTLCESVIRYGRSKRP